MMDILEKEKESIDWVALMLPKVVISQEVNPKYKVSDSCTINRTKYIVILLMNYTPYHCRPTPKQ